MNEDKITRLKYIQGLEKFYSKVVSISRKNNINKAQFILYLSQAVQKLEKIKKTRVNSSYLVRLQNYKSYIDKIIIDKDIDLNETITFLHKESNLISKEKNKLSYKKNKHKKQGFSDGY